MSEKLGTENDLTPSAELMSEIFALRAVVAQCVATIALLDGKDSSFFPIMRDLAKQSVSLQKLTVSDVNVDHLRANSEARVDAIFNSIEVALPSPREEGVDVASMLRHWG